MKVHFPGSTGNQFGRRMYTTAMPFKVVEDILSVYPEVQRKLNKPRAKKISDYILKGLNKRNFCFLSAITATTRGIIEYDSTSNQLLLDYGDKLSVNDGQHRFEGIKMALNTVRKELIETRDKESKKAIKEKLEYLEKMCISVVIFDDMDEVHEQQLFHDLNLLASKPPKSVSLKYDSSDLYNLMARELKDENDYLEQFGVDTERTILNEKHEELMVLSTLRNTIAYIIVGNDGKDKGNSLENPEIYETRKEEVSQILNEIFEALPTDCNDRTKYILGTAATIQGIGKFINHLKKNNLNISEHIARLEEINWSPQNPIWDGAGGHYDSNKNKLIFSGTGAGVNGICNVLIEYLVNNSQVVA
ncbi:DNA sulfur modification protein DndB [Paenibacillus sp. LjRoot56]|uniref:DNA sulfur modification protein DndB n=1 Tax=Paenibacillus sp. LjRoot56 TaxID=3342333 RepID=UPI003ECF6C00